MYSDADKSDAYALFIHGLSYRKIAEHLQRKRIGCRKLSHSTVQKWAETPDAAGLTWEDKKAELSQLAQAQADGQIVKSKVDILAEGNELLESIVRDLKSDTLEFKTKGEAAYTFKAISQLMEQIGDKRKRVAVEEQAKCLIDAMHEIPELKAVLEEHWSQVYEIFKRKVLALAETKRHG